MSHRRRRLAVRTLAVILCGLSSSAEAGWDEARAAYDRKDFPAAVSELRPLADKGDAPAMTTLVWMHLNGKAPAIAPGEARRLAETAADSGNAEGAYWLALMLQDGIGGPKDAPRANRMLQAAWKGGVTDAARLIGMSYFDGTGVERNDAEAVRWYRLAIEAGDLRAQALLGMMYSNGFGVEKDELEAVRLYHKALAGGDAKVRPVYDEALRSRSRKVAAKTANLRTGPDAKAEIATTLSQGDTVYAFHTRGDWIRVFDKATGKDGWMKAELLAAAPAPAAKGPEVFGVELATATRAAMRSAIKENNAPVKREDDGYWYDVYEASGNLEGADELIVGYTREGKLGRLCYVFPSHVDAQQVKRVADLVMQKYGKPSKSTGNVRLGEMTYTWSLAKNVVLNVRRGWPDTTTYLEFIIAPSYQTMRSEMDENDRQRTQQKAKQQTNAF